MRDASDRAEQKRLVIFIYELSVGGAQRRTVTIANSLARRGHAVDLLVTRAGGELESELSARVRVVDVGLARMSLIPKRYHNRRHLLRLSIPKLAVYLWRKRPDTFLSAASHANRVAPFAWLLSGARAKFVLRISNHLSASSRNGLRKERSGRKQIAELFYRHADEIIAVSRGVADDLAEVTGLPRASIHTVYNPVVTPELSSQALEPLEHPWFRPGAPPVLLNVGRLVTQKDHATLIRAFARVRQRCDARLMILGEGKKRERLLGLAEDLGVAEHVSLPGRVANPLPYMVRSGALVLSSVWEGLPGVLIEAMACGCPVVSTDCPSGPAEILVDGRYGALVPVGDEVALAEGIHETLLRPISPGVLRRRAAEFSLPRAIARYEQILFDAVHEPSPRFASSREAYDPGVAAGSVHLR